MKQTGALVAEGARDDMAGVTIGGPCSFVGVASVDQRRQLEQSMATTQHQNHVGAVLHPWTMKNNARSHAKAGKAYRPRERSFSKDTELASEAGSKGGKSVPAEERSFSKDRELASEAGRKGGKASGGSSSGGSHEQHVKAGQQSHKNR